MVYKTVPTLQDYQDTLKKFKGYYCPKKINTKTHKNTKDIG